MPDSNRSEVVSVNCEGFSTPPPPPFVYMILLKLAYSIGDQTAQKHRLFIYNYVFFVLTFFIIYQY